MRLRVASVAVIAGLLGWIVAAAFVAGPPAADAQQAPVQIGRVRQKAGFLPKPRGAQPIVILAIGSDARPGQPVDRLRADSIHLITVNPKRGAATIIGFPRDSYVGIPGRGTSKINDSMVYGGPQLLARTVESVTGIKIDYWMLTSFKGFSRMVDGIGGVSLKVRYPMFDDAAGTRFGPGKQHFRGGEALAFARDRHSAPGGDFGRSENQGRLMMAALKKFRKKFAQDPAVLFQWIRVGMKNVQTDLSLGEVIKLGLLAAQVQPKRVRNVVVPGSTGSAGGASVVFISGSAQAMFRDVKADGILG